MAQISDKYIKGFVKTCFEAGVHEKQAAALLDAVISSKESMEKSATGTQGLVNIMKGIGQLGAAGATKGIPALWNLATLPARPFMWWGKHVIANPAKRLLETNPRRVFGHVALTGALPAGLAIEGPVKWFQQWRDNSDSPIAAGINDLIGRPEWFKDGIVGNPLSDSSASLPSAAPSYAPYSGGSSRSTSSSESPNNIPGINGYSSAGEAKLNGASSASDVLKGLSETERNAVDDYTSALAAAEKARRTGSSSISAARRAREGATGNKELEEAVKEKHDILSKLLAANNADRVSRNARNQAIAANAANRFRQAVNEDKFQSRIGFDDDNFFGNLGNKGLQALGVMDDSADLVARERNLGALRDINKSWSQWKPEELIDVNKVLEEARKRSKNNK